MEKQLITSVFSGGARSSKKYHSEPLPPMQEVDLNDAALNARRKHTLTRQSGSASAPVSCLEAEARDRGLCIIGTEK
jgi:hypothetical protein